MHNRLEDYLEEVTKQLGSLPAERRDEELREMRQHLQEAVANSREQGLSEGQAVAAALTRFGTPKEAARSVIGAQRREVRKQWGRKCSRYLITWAIVDTFVYALYSIALHPYGEGLLRWCWLLGVVVLLPMFSGRLMSRFLANVR